MTKTQVELCCRLLRVLGISATIVSSISCEYGSPYSDYSIKGKVVDSETGKGVPDIEVSYNDRDTTKLDGSFGISGESFGSADIIKLCLKDIDPEKDGAYKTTIKDVELIQTQPGYGRWDRGTYEASDVILKIEKQESK